MKISKKNKWMAIGAIAGAAVMGVGAVALVSKGFKNMDARDWVGGYEHVLEVKEDSQDLCPDFASVSGLEWSFNQDKRAVIKFKSSEGAHASAKLFDQDGKEFIRENFTLSAKISIKDEGMAGFGFGVDASASSFKVISFMLDYDKQSKLLRVVAYNNNIIDYVPSDMDSTTCVHDAIATYSNGYSLSYYGLKDLNDIKFSVTKTLTSDGSKYVIRVGNKTIDLLGEYASDQISRGGQLKIFDSEDFIEEECVILDKEKLIKGIKLYVSNSSTNILVQDRKQGLIIDTCQVDAEVADCIIQYALFDEIVFG